MVADVCLGKVGAVAAREVSRFARNSRDWQQLVEIRQLKLQLPPQPPPRIATANVPNHPL
jgi:hypothetical protein